MFFPSAFNYKFLEHREDVRSSSFICHRIGLDVIGFLTCFHWHAASISQKSLSYNFSLSVLFPGASLLSSEISSSNWKGIMEHRTRLHSTGWPPDYSSHTDEENEMLSFHLEGSIRCSSSLFAGKCDNCTCECTSLFLKYVWGPEEQIPSFINVSFANSKQNCFKKRNKTPNLEICFYIKCCHISFGFLSY